MYPVLILHMIQCFPAQIAALLNVKTKVRFYFQHLGSADTTAPEMKRKLLFISIVKRAEKTEKNCLPLFWQVITKRLNLTC